MSKKVKEQADKVSKLKDKNSSLKDKLVEKDNQIEYLNQLVGIQSIKLKELGVDSEQLVSSEKGKYQKLEDKYKVMKVYAESVNEILRKVLKKGQMSNEKIEYRLDSIAEKLEKA